METITTNIKVFAFSISVVNMPLLLDGNAICKHYLSQISTVNKIFTDYNIFLSCYLQYYFGKKKKKSSNF